MNKNLKLSYILYFVLAGMVLSFRSQILFFGVGFAFALLLAVFACLTFLFVKGEKLKVIDLFSLSSAFVVLELPVFFAGEIAINGLSLGMLAYQSTISCLGLLAFIYVAARWILASNGKVLTFSFSKKEKRVKTTRELTNGSLEEKPKKLNEQSLFEDVKTGTDHEKETSENKQNLINKLESKTMAENKPTFDEDSEN